MGHSRPEQEPGVACEVPLPVSAKQGRKKQEGGGESEKHARESKESRQKVGQRERQRVTGGK